MPNNPKDQGAGATGVVQRLLKLRRSNGVALVLATQNPTEVSEKVRNMVRIRFIGFGIEGELLKSLFHKKVPKKQGGMNYPTTVNNFEFVLNVTSKDDVADDADAEAASEDNVTVNYRGFQAQVRQQSEPPRGRQRPRTRAGVP